MSACATCHARSNAVRAFGSGLLLLLSCGTASITFRVILASFSKVARRKFFRTAACSGFIGPPAESVLTSERGTGQLSVCEAYELREFITRRSGVNRPFSQRNAFAKTRGGARGNQRRSGIHEHGIPYGTGLSVQDAAEQHGILRGVAAAQRRHRRAPYAEVLRRNAHHPHRAIAHHSHFGFAAQRDFIQASVAMHY